MDEAALLAELTKVRGVGEWTVHMFMIFSLHRPDVLPCGDLGVRKGVQELYKLKALPHPEEMAALCERWRPYQSVGAWYMWRLMESKGAAAKKKNKAASTAVVKTCLPEITHLKIKQKKRTIKEAKNYPKLAYLHC
ncbi:unnamed protein product [Miscanthus lutarioriparius]|uniref:HhH-GPD domain-containing protein n=1 Tax=Miscanthus lutarioriparius TaxID=422564 RepID=A0A811RUQ3_9POAL|nr:unnamed protein product [Miscanthus lutarioriparius]